MVKSNCCNGAIDNEEMNSSYENVKKEANPSPANFDVGKEMQLLVHFNNHHFSIDHVQSYVLDSLVLKYCQQNNSISTLEVNI
jgi:hypothetical protein